MLVNVLFDGLLQFPSAAEHPAAQLLLCQRREPALHLVQPRAAGGGEVQVIARPPGQPALDGGGLVGGVVVQDKVHVEVRGYGRIDPVEEAPELRGPVPTVAGADDLSRLHVEGGEERGRTMTTVVMGPALDLPRAHGQQRGRPVEGLDLGLLVDTQDQSPLGWVEVEPHDVTDLLDEQRVRRKFERLGPMRLQGKGPPDTADGALTQAGTRSHGARAPVGCIRRRRLQGEGHDPLHIGVRDGAWAAGPRLVKQAVEAAFDEPGPPLPHRLLGQTDLPGHDGIGLALGATENDPGSQSQRLGSGWTPLPALEALAFVGEKVQGRNGASDGHGDLHERFVEGTPQQVLSQCFHNSGH